MRVVRQHLWAAALLCGPLGIGAPSADAESDCRPKALALLRSSSPAGFAIFRQTSRTAFFESWIDCDAPQFDLSTAVHESAHLIAAETDAFPLVGGGAIARPHLVSDFFPPARIATRFPHDEFATIYLRQGKASSSSDFLYLLDELNAYSHDLATAVELRGLRTNDDAVDHRDGLAALMAFVAIYAETAKASETETWDGLREPEVARTITALWSRGEHVMASSCGIPDFGAKDKSYIRMSCAPGASAAVADILGRPPVCPTACLAPDVDDGHERTDADVAPPSYRIAPGAYEQETDDRKGGAALSERPHHPFNIEIGPSRRRHRAEGSPAARMRPGHTVVDHQPQRQS